MSMRSGASVSQLLAESVGAGGGADYTRGVGSIHGDGPFANLRQVSRMSRSATRSVAACASSSIAGQLCSVSAPFGFVQVPAHRKFHLQRMYADFGLAIVARDPAAAEAAVGDAAECGCRADLFDARGQRRVAARAIVRADVELRQLAVEQSLHARTDGMRVIDHDAADACREAAGTLRRGAGDKA